MDLFTKVAWLLCITAAVVLAARFQRVILLLGVIGLTVFASVQDRADIMGYIKLMFLLPLGLGSLLTFALLRETTQHRNLPWFTRYINFAVVSNILIMLAAPTGGTLRGLVSRAVCLALVIWLLQEMAKKRYQTTAFDRGIFLFRSSPLSWIACHACYRIALLSLPVFQTRSYLLLEPLSLATMVALYYLHQKRQPLSHYFGFADTLVVCTLTVLSHFAWIPVLKTEGWKLASLSEQQWDVIFLPVQLTVLGFAMWTIVCNARALAQRPWRISWDCAKLSTDTVAKQNGEGPCSKR